MKADRLSYVERYVDSSDVEFGVTYKNKPYLHDNSIVGVVEIEHLHTVEFPITKIDWLIECLERVRQNHYDCQEET